MRTRDFQLLFVILGLVLSAALMSDPPLLRTSILSLFALSGSLFAFSVWVRSRASRSRTILVSGSAVLLAASLWLEFVLFSIETPLRWLLALALAWMISLPAAFALASLSDRLLGLR